MNETSLHYLQPDQGINKKQHRRNFPQNSTQYLGSEAKKTCFMLNLTEDEIYHAHK